MANQPAPKGTLKDAAYHHIKQKILSCEMLPGQPIYEKQLSEELDGGRTPVREALLTLKNEGLVHIFPHKGMCVAPITESSITEVHQLRKLLEPTVCVQYKNVLSKSTLLDYEHRFKTLDVNNDRAYYALDIEFHQYLISIAGNATLDRFFQGLMQVQYRLGMYSTLRQKVDKAHYCQKHADLIAAILSEQDSEIMAKLTDHINESLLIALRTLRQPET